MISSPSAVRLHVGRSGQAAQAAILAAWTVLGGTAWAQLGSFNVPSSDVSRATLAVTPSVPAFASVELPLQTANASPSFPMTVTRAFMNLFLGIPDNSAVGITHQQEVSGVPGTIAALQVQLTISSRGTGPMFNGDLFATLSHSSGYSVLLNRVGRRTDSAVGYGDNGFDVTLADSATADIHSYRVSLSGNELLPISNTDPATPLSGLWQPDGRTADPESVLTGSPRSASLTSFNGLDPNGTWTLYLADLGAGGLAELDSWSMEFAVVPEPEVTVGVTGLALLVAALLRRRFHRPGQ